ncbi:hypothetical protein CP488_01579 [Chthonomonas calidirosea]|nr:hypothetical protein CP488_01579 [Chthonomonas calidirosea]
MLTLREKVKRFPLDKKRLTFHSGLFPPSNHLLLSTLAVQEGFLLGRAEEGDFQTTVEEMILKSYSDFACSRNGTTINLLTMCQSMHQRRG